MTYINIQCCISVILFVCFSCFKNIMQSRLMLSKSQTLLNVKENNYVIARFSTTMFVWNPWQPNLDHNQNCV